MFNIVSSCSRNFSESKSVCTIQFHLMTIWKRKYIQKNLQKGSDGSQRSFDYVVLRPHELSWRWRKSEKSQSGSLQRNVPFRNLINSLQPSSNPIQHTGAAPSQEKLPVPGAKSRSTCCLLLPAKQQLLSAWPVKIA